MILFSVQLEMKKYFTILFFVLLFFGSFFLFFQANSEIKQQEEENQEKQKKINLTTKTSWNQINVGSLVNFGSFKYDKLNS